MKNLIFLSLIFCMLFSCSKPCMQAFTKVNPITNADTITIEKCNVVTTGYVGFICDSAYRYNQLIVPDAKYSWIKPGMCYNISLTDFDALLLDAVKKPYVLRIAELSVQSIAYFNVTGFLKKNNTNWFVLENARKKIKMESTMFHKNTILLLVHKDAARIVLDKIIK